MTSPLAEQGRFKTDVLIKEPYHRYSFVVFNVRYTTVGCVIRQFGRNGSLESPYQGGNGVAEEVKASPFGRGGSEGDGEGIIPEGGSEVLRSEK